MKYWAYINNEVLGPFEKEKLREVPGFGLTSLICAEGAQAEGWKEASTISEVRAALMPSPAPSPAKPQTPPRMTPQRMAEESPLAMTMRGTLIDMSAAPAPAAGQLKPAGTAAPAAAPQLPAAESPLAMTMRGSLIETPLAAEPEPAPARYRPTHSPEPVRAPAYAAPQAAAPAASGISLSPQSSASELEQLKQKLEQMSALLTSMGDSQFQLLGRLSRLENAIMEIKALISPPQPK